MFEISVIYSVLLCLLNCRFPIRCPSPTALSPAFA